MKNMKHTPGPWLAWDTGNGMSICPATAQDALIPNLAAFATEICRLKPSNDLTGQEWDYEWEVKKADARLMASSPDLLAVLQDFVAYLGDGETPSERALVTKSRLAIAKAKGES